MKYEYNYFFFNIVGDPRNPPNNAHVAKAKIDQFNVLGEEGWKIVYDTMSEHGSLREKMRELGANRNSPESVSIPLFLVTVLMVREKSDEPKE